jgi:hypothetical protein
MIGRFDLFVVGLVQGSRSTIEIDGLIDATK